MTNQDLSVIATMSVPSGAAINNKPCYLITLTEKVSAGVGKLMKHRRFLALELPTMEAAHIQCKGFFLGQQDDEAVIATSFRQIVQTTDKDSITELFLPWHSVCSIRNLVFKAK
jgi:hypothetical protein